jgi:hypothetical protein
MILPLLISGSSSKTLSLRGFNRFSSTYQTYVILLGSTYGRIEKNRMLLVPFQSNHNSPPPIPLGPNSYSCFDFFNLFAQTSHVCDYWYMGSYLTCYRLYLSHTCDFIINKTSTHQILFEIVIGGRESPAEFRFLMFYIVQEEILLRQSIIWALWSLFFHLWDHRERSSTILMMMRLQDTMLH